MQRATRAAILSLLIPGAGLWYSGHGRLGIINFVVALCLPAAGFLTGFMAEHVHYVFLAIAAGSAGLAHALCGPDPPAGNSRHAAAPGSDRPH